MFNLIIILIVTTPITIIICCHILRARARTWADQVIAGNWQANATELNKYITTILSMNNSVLGRSEQDRQRISQLRNIRNALILKHN
ncbi:MAG: hypothetical protein CEE41_05305 [Hadesarchaea archaeon B3_Hades]|nr:MAG: hypothetical protein CEE41_05305 [Hadesarchaea archaeon B3_Hades]